MMGRARALALGLALALAVPLAGCGGDEPDLTARDSAALPGDPPVAEVEAFSGDAGAEQFVRVALTACQVAVESARQAPNAGANAAAVRRFARSAAAPLQRLDQAIGVLAQQRPASDEQLRPIRAAVRAAMPLIGGAAAGDESSNAPALEAVERLRVTAADAGFPGCALR